VPPTIVPVTPRKVPSLKRLLLITLAMDVVLVPLAIWTVVQAGQWTVVISLCVWHALLPLVLRIQRSVRSNQVERLEVSGERIDAVTGRGVGSALERASGGLVRVRHIGGSVMLKVVGPSGGENGLVILPGVDLADLRRALLEHGWSVQDGEHGDVAVSSGPVTAPAAPEGTTLVLREGVPKVGLRSPISWILLALGALPVVVGGLFLDVGSPLFQPVLLGPWAIALVVVWTTVSVKAQRHEMTVSPERIVVRAGSITRTADRSRIAKVLAGDRQLRYADAQGRPLMWVSLRWRREEVLDLLRSRGWPTY